jgi:hypothetical protein
MKIAAGIPQASALDVWLRDAEITDTKNAALVGTDGPVATPSASDTASPRDTAEILLDLDVWSGSSSSRTLTSSAPPPADEGPDTPAQSWTEHIFGPLL